MDDFDNEITDETWFKHYRKTVNWRYRSHPAIYSVWMYLLEKATWREGWREVHGQQVYLKPGQSIIGRYVISKKTGIAAGSISRILKKLEIEHQIEQQKTNKYTIISIVNWTDYQSCEHQDEQQMNTKRATDEQQMSTIKKDNKDNKEKKEKNNIILKNCLDALPIHFQTPIGIEAMTDWFNSRKEKRKPITPTWLKLLIKQITSWTPERFQAAVIHSQGYQGLFEPSGNGKQQMNSNFRPMTLSEKDFK